MIFYDGAAFIPIYWFTKPCFTFTLSLLYTIFASILYGIPHRSAFYVPKNNIA